MLLLKRAGQALFGLKFLFSTLEGNQDFRMNVTQTESSFGSWAH